MTAVLYHTTVFYGYNVQIPTGYTYKNFITFVDGLNGILSEPFRFTGLLNDFDTSGVSYDNAKIVLGFEPGCDLEEVLSLSKELKEFVEDNPLLDGIQIDNVAKFYSGVDWFYYKVNYAYDDDSTEFESDSDEDSDDLDEEDEESIHEYSEEEESLDELENDSEEF